MILFRSSQTQELDLNVLEQGMPGITPRIGAALAEAAITCLEQENHAPDARMEIDGACKHRVALRWAQDGDPAQRARAWGDTEKATENGACGIAALLIVELTDLTVVEMARRGPGFDYWLGQQDDASTLFQNKARLEVSGLRKGDEKAVEARTRQKLKQIKPASDGLPGVVAVVEFSAPFTRLELK